MRTVILFSCLCAKYEVTACSRKRGNMKMSFRGAGSSRVCFTFGQLLAPASSLYAKLSESPAASCLMDRYKSVIDRSTLMDLSVFM